MPVVVLGSFDFIASFLVSIYFNVVATRLSDESLVRKRISQLIHSSGFFRVFRIFFFLVFKQTPPTKKKKKRKNPQKTNKKKNAAVKQYALLV